MTAHDELAAGAGRARRDAMHCTLGFPMWLACRGRTRRGARPGPRFAGGGASATATSRRRRPIERCGIRSRAAEPIEHPATGGLQREHA